MRVRIVRRNIIEKHSFVCHHVQRFSEISRNVRASLPGDRFRNHRRSRERESLVFSHTLGSIQSRRDIVNCIYNRLSWCKSCLTLQQSPFQRNLSVSSSFSSEVSVSKSLSLVKIVARLIVKAIGCKSEIAKERERERRREKEGKGERKRATHFIRIG